MLYTNNKNCLFSYVAIASTCEDALINCSSKGIPDEAYENTGPDVVPSILSSEVAAEQWVRRGHIPLLAGHGSFGKSRAILYRLGKAWVGLERAREAVGWLPSDVLNTQDQKDIEDEDPERLEGSTTNSLQSRTRRASLQQRLFLLCLEFLGAYDSDIAKSHYFPIDIRFVHDLPSVGSIQRQGLTPFPTQSWISSNLEAANNQTNNDNNKEQLNTPSQLANEHQDVWAQAHRCFIDAALTQMNEMPSWWPSELKESWLTTLSKLRFTVALERLSNAIQTNLVNVKTAISIRRNCGRTIISEGKNQKDLNLWRAYAKGFWQISQDILVTATSQDAEILIQESRRIFDSALNMYPIPEDFGPSINDMDKLTEFYQTVYTPRLKLLQKTLTSISRSNIRQQQQQQSMHFCEGLIGTEINSLIGHQLELCSACLPSILDLFILSLELERWTCLIAGVTCDYGEGRNSVSDQRVRSAFEKAVQISSFLTPLVSLEGNLIHIALCASTPTYWSAHLRLVIWRAYMAFSWMAGPPHASNTSTTAIANNLDLRQRRQAVKAVFYRAVEDVPWAKVLYTDLGRCCPEDVEEVVDLLSERELRLRTPLEEVDLLLTARPHE
ncbi:hypothetical protein MN116_008871 [Schistosoma mekongi]|uniref:Uncharacterized protein n=1 Tax=Schistosoma mekongi TaxID=38744 RepID=A0AAE1Z4Q6_SCHME|nr:hypothetical protein MN116_008871 [Schistosoma mekongi]